MRWINTLVAVAIVLASAPTVKAAEAGMPEPAEPVSLSLDAGFVGRPVSLDLFGGSVTVAWAAGTLIAPTGLTVSFADAVTSTEDQIVAGKGVRVAFDDAAAVNPKGSFTVSVKALRPPASSEYPEATIVADGMASSTVVNGSFAKDRATVKTSAAAAFTVSPAFRDGIMREGKASWYAYKKCLCAASPDVPKGTRMLVRRADNPEKFVVVTVNDWGPERDKHPERVIDLDKVAFARIGNPRGGVMDVTVEVLPPTDPRWKLGDELPPPNWKKLQAALAAPKTK